MSIPCHNFPFQNVFDWGLPCHTHPENVGPLEDCVQLVLVEHPNLQDVLVVKLVRVVHTERYASRHHQSLQVNQDRFMRNI